MRWKTTAGNGTTGYTFLVLLSSLTNLEGHKNNVCDPTVWHPLKNSMLCSLNTLLSIMLSTYTACVSFLLFSFFLCTTYCMQHDSGYIVYEASLDIGRLFFKTNAKWKGSITLPRPDRWCKQPQLVLSCVQKQREKGNSLCCGLWTLKISVCVLCAYSHHHSVLLTATVMWDCRPHQLPYCCCWWLCCYSDISLLN